MGEAGENGQGAGAGAESGDGPPQWVSIAGIERHLLSAGGATMTRSSIQRFHATVAPLLGARGTLYPPASLRWWEAIAEGRQDSKIALRPENAAGWLELLMARESATGAGGGNQQPATAVKPGLTDERQPESGDRVSIIEAGTVPTAALSLVPTGDQAERFLRAVEQVAATLARSSAAQGHAGPLDALLTAEEAMRESGLSISTLRRLPSVKEGRARKWFRSTLAAHLADLRLSITDHREK